MRSELSVRRVLCVFVVAGVGAVLAAVQPVATASTVTPAPARQSVSTPVVSAPVLISRTPSGAIPDEESDLGPVSGDGRYLTYSSRATDIVPGVSKVDSRAFLFDRDTGTTVLLATHRDGAPWAGASTPVGFSPADRYAYFDWVPSGQSLPAYRDPAAGNTYRYDTSTGVVTQVSDLALTPSANGRFGVLTTYAQLTPQDTNDSPDDYWIDLADGSAHLITTNADGSADGDAFDSLHTLAISRDGQRVAYQALVDVPPGDPKAAILQIFVWDASTQTSTRVSQSPTGHGGNGLSEYPTISGDGQVVAYATEALNLHATGVVYRDLRYTYTRQVAVPAGDSQPGPAAPSLSTHGRYVAFVTGAPGDGFVAGVVRTDRTTGESLDLFDGVGGYVAPPAISGDGSVVAYSFYSAPAPPAVYAIAIQ